MIERHFFHEEEGNFQLSLNVIHESLQVVDITEAISVDISTVKFETTKMCV